MVVGSVGGNCEGPLFLRAVVIYEAIFVPDCGVDDRYLRGDRSSVLAEDRDVTGIHFDTDDVAVGEEGSVMQRGEADVGTQVEDDRALGKFDFGEVIEADKGVIEDAGISGAGTEVDGPVTQSFAVDADERLTFFAVIEALEKGGLIGLGRKCCAQ